MTDQNDKQMMDIFRDMQKNLATLARSGTLGGSSGGSGRAVTNAIDEALLSDNEREIRLGTKNLSAYNKSIKHAMKIVEKLTDAKAQQVVDEQAIGKASRLLEEAFSNAAKSHQSLSVAVNQMARTAVPLQTRAFKNLVKGSAALSNSFSANARISSALNASLIQRAAEVDKDASSASFGRYMDQLAEASSTLPESLLKSVGILNEGIGSFAERLNDNLDPDDFASLRTKIGDAEVALSEAFGGSDGLFANLDSTLASIASIGVARAVKGEDTTKAENSILQAAVGLKAAGISLSDSSNKIIDALKEGATISPDDYKVLASELKNFNAGLKQGRDGLDKLGARANSAAQRFNIAEVQDSLKNKAADLLTFSGTIAALKTTADKLAKVFNEASAFNIAQIPASFLEVQEQSIRMGMSFEETSKFMQENKRVMGLYGADAFGALRSGLEDTFNQFGYTFAQAASFIGPATEAAIASSVNIQDSEALNKYMKDTMASFQKISGIINISAEDYAKLNTELHSSPDIMNHMLGMTAEQSQLYARSLEQQRDQIAVNGVSIQQANEIVKAQQAQKRAKVTERIRASAYQQMIGGMVGMSQEETAELARLTRKTSRAGDEEKRYNELSKKFAAGFATFETNARETDNVSQQVLGERLREQMPGFFNDIMTTQGEAIKGTKANAAATEGQRDAASGAASGSAAMAYLGETVNAVSSVLNNSLVSAAGAASVSLFALFAAAGKAAWALNKLGIDSPAGLGIGGKIKSAGGKLVGIGGKVLKGGGLLGAGVIGAGMLGSYALESAGMTKPAAAVDIASQIAGGAVTGAAVGSLIPIPLVGTAVGALAGGAAGAYSAYKSGAFGKFAGPTATPSAMPAAAKVIVPERAITGESVNSKSIQAPNGVLNVKDADSYQQLVVIAQQMSEAVKLLSELSKPNQPSTSVVRLPLGSSLKPAIPTSTSYTSGRAM